MLASFFPFLCHFAGLLLKAFLSECQFQHSVFKKRCFLKRDAFLKRDEISFFFMLIFSCLFGWHFKHTAPNISVPWPVHWYANELHYLCRALY